MNLLTTKKFNKKFKKLSPQTQKTFQKQIGFLLSGNNHPSLNLKKMQGLVNIWECRLNKAHRFTFQIINKTIILRTIGTHDILNKP